MNRKKFLLCQLLARGIVERYRAEAPAGFDPVNSYVALAGVVVSAGTAAYGAYQKNKEQKAAQGAVANGGAAFGSVPKPALYEPVNFDEAQRASIMGNDNNLTAINDLVYNSNKYLDADAMTRANRFVPGYKTAMRTYGAAGNDLLNGRLPFGDVSKIVSDRTDLTNALGTPGAGGFNGTLKDLGVSQLDAIKTGGSILKDMVGIAETVNPVNRRSRPQDMFVTPSERIPWELQQHQLEQQSQQNANNLAAAGDPAAYAQLQLQLAQGGQNAQSGNGYVNAAGSLISGALAAYGKSNSSGWSGNTSLVSGQGPNFYSNKPAYYNGVVVPRATAVV